MMRILWHSNAPMAPTGYGNQTREFTPRIQAAGHEVVISAYWGIEGARLNYNGMMMLPRGDHLFGNDVIEPHAMATRADVVLTLMDVWVLPHEVMARLPWAAWTPVDHEPLQPSVAKRLSVCRWPIAMSQFGFRMMKEAGLEALYVPHGVDTERFSPTDRKAAREKLAKVLNARHEREAVNEDTFLAVMVAANKGWPSRKGFAEALEAWARFAMHHTNVHLYLHTDLIGNQGVDFGILMDALGVNRDTVSFAPLYDYTTGGIGPEYLNDVYNAADVLLNPAMGEGFGIPIVEAQAAGCPVIVGGWTAMNELVFSGWRVDGHRWMTPAYAFQWIPDVPSIANALEEAWETRGDLAQRQRAREGAEMYDAARVMEEYWTPALGRIEDELTRNAAAVELLEEAVADHAAEVAR